MNVIRTAGTQTQRGNASIDWERPAVGQIGDLWNIVFHLDTVAYNAIRMNLEPDFRLFDQVDTGRALPTAAVSVRLPMPRAGGTLGSQVIEPILQVAASPNVGSSQSIRYPDEDSLAFEYSDTTCSRSTASPVSTGWRGVAPPSGCMVRGWSATSRWTG